MMIRPAETYDISQIQLVRNAEKENRLSNPALVSDADVETYLTVRGKGWVCIHDNIVTGFAIVDLVENNVWALFVHPDFEAMGIGKKLHRVMMDWYFLQTMEKIWLGTEPNSRAERFYRMQGWQEAGLHGKGEIKFEMDHKTWSALHL